MIGTIPNNIALGESINKHCDGYDIIEVRQKNIDDMRAAARQFLKSKCQFQTQSIYGYCCQKQLSNQIIREVF